MVYQYSYWEFSSVAFSFLVSFCEQFEIVWRSHISITQGVNELTEEKESIVHSNNVLMLMIFVDYIKNFVPWFDCYTLALWGKPNFLNTYWGQHKQFHHEALTNESMLTVKKDRRNQWLTRLFLVNEIDKLFINHSLSIANITAYNWAGVKIKVSTTHKSNSCWIHNDVHEDASVPRTKRPQWFIEDY